MKLSMYLCTLRIICHTYYLYYCTAGKVNLSSPDHVSLLVHRTFNVSIPRHHIPTDNWEFEYGPAANDPEFGADAADGDEAQPEAGEGEAVVDGGRWVHKLTGERLGEPDGILQFTVVGYVFFFMLRMFGARLMFGVG